MFDREVDLLRKLYGFVDIPFEVATELTHPHTPGPARLWMQHPPAWLRVNSGVSSPQQWPQLDKGERASLALAAYLGAPTLLADDGDARAAAEAENLKCTGTIGVLYEAAVEGHPQGETMAHAFEQALLKLRNTNFFFSANLNTALARLIKDLHQRAVD